MHQVNGRARKKYRWIFVDKEVNIGVMKIQTEVVNGKCPTCDEFTMLVGITNQLYRCMNCGSDLEQHVNGKISYLPHITRPGDETPFVKEWKDG